MSSPSTDADGAVQQRQNRDVVISVRDLVVGFGDRTIVKGLNLDVFRGEVLGVVGGSGQGKSVLTRAILGLVPTRAGAIRIFGQDRERPGPGRTPNSRAALGCVVSERGAFLGAYRQAEHPDADARNTRHFATSDGRTGHAQARAGWPRSRRRRQISVRIVGRHVKRAALARALALDPELVFLDEPTSGLDPISAAELTKPTGTPSEQTLRD